jgi:hypothetical protein
MPKKLKRSSKKISVSLKKVEWYGLKHDLIAKKFEGDLEFVNYMNVGSGGDNVAAVYSVRKPNKGKGHKGFMLLFKAYPSESSTWYVSGMDLKTVKKHALVEGVLCLSCNQALWSLSRNHFHDCGCNNETFVDGGKDYLRYGAKSLKKTALVTINLLTDEVVVDSKAKVK